MRGLKEHTARHCPQPREFEESHGRPNPRVLLGVLVMCVLAGCAAGAGTTTATASPSSAATPSPVATPSPTISPTPEPVSAAEVVAVANHFWFGSSPNPCHVLDCPITPRLAARMAELIKIQSGQKTGTVDLWCRCQNGLVQTITGEVTPDGGIAHTVWGTRLKMDFLMVVQDGKLLVDDTQCTGLGPTSSIYGPEGLTPCEFQTP